MIRFLVALIVLFATAGPAIAAKQKIFMAPQAEYEAWFNSNISVNRSMEVMDTVDARRMSPNEKYWFTITYALVNQAPSGQRLDYSIHIYKGGAYFITITLFDMLMEGVPEVRWINDKQLYLEFWWKRKLGAYMIFDTENEYIAVRDMIFTEPPERMQSYEDFRR
jgi:hypothetical protein